ncbi:acyl-CoA synthetase FdrA [Thermotalea metallivorans]|uniref:Succinyl-CoA ligase [ADP-forming] subunit alpha n=1 Tax=Thermotalea metallivorans TaxID=520762 RepID=A0A140L137_9FIRM|nr:acyl-CoA synthetase FdrA [Thermotalea metallivorans]KXG74262.1 Succinyl-CoA ligase [ADP-forming] subunit alpha [Thermotalea metallivorans]
MQTQPVEEQREGGREVCQSLEIRKNTYYDSVTLMLMSKEIKKMEGVREALIGMGTELNKALAVNLGMGDERIQALNPGDFFIAILWEKEDRMTKVIKRVDELLHEKKPSSALDYRPVTLDSAVKHTPDANLALISLPGKYVFEEARKALDLGLHVMLFSDNVSIEEEKQLKELAREKGLLMMGPDCGTAIINAVPLAFANVVRRGDIGIVGASGTGTQEVSVMIHKLGRGVSQVLGTGGRDLKREIGGIMMIEGIKALGEDENTKVIVLISKPPAPEVAEKMLQAAKDSKKPVVVNFIGGDMEMIEQYGMVPGLTLEDTAYKAVALSKGEAVKDMLGFMMSEEEIEAVVRRETKELKAGQRYLRGLYTGGTLCDEAMKLLTDAVGPIYSNIPLEEGYRLENVYRSYSHTCIDLGDDLFTLNRPHPMIDPSYRQERLKIELEDETVAVILMDFVLGYGSHPDPVGEMLPIMMEGKQKRQEKGLGTCFIASICGTEQDPQNLRKQEERLKEAGVVVMPSNAQAARMAAKILKRIL